MRDAEERRWVLCPQCGDKTRLRLFQETERKACPPVLGKTLSAFENAQDADQNFAYTCRARSNSM